MKRLTNTWTLPDLKKSMAHKSNGDPNFIWCVWNGSLRPRKRLEGVKIRGKMGTVQITTLLRSTRILRRILETLDLPSLRLQ